LTRWRSSKRCTRPDCPRNPDGASRIAVIAFNALSSSPSRQDRSQAPPGMVEVLLKAAGTAADAFSFESVEALRDTAARWRTMRNSFVLTDQAADRLRAAAGKIIMDAPGFHRLL
jgi:hypothetical protein